MQLMPKQLIGNIGGAYLKNSKSVLFHPQNCEALESLTKVMSSGFVSLSHLILWPFITVMENEAVTRWKLMNSLLWNM
jgi:mediator of RNA polymerase II transcription subunit 25